MIQRAAGGASGAAQPLLDLFGVLAQVGRRQGVAEIGSPERDRITIESRSAVPSDYHAPPDLVALR